MTTHPPTQTVSDPTYLFHPDNHLLDKKPTESDKDMEWTTNPPTEPRECNCIDCRVGRDLGLKPNYPTEPTVEKWEFKCDRCKKVEKVPEFVAEHLRGKNPPWCNKCEDEYRYWLNNPNQAHSLQEAKEQQHGKSFTEGYNQGRASGIEDEKKWLDKKVQEAKAERDKFWINRINIMLDGVQDAYGEWYKDRLTKLSTLNTKGGK